jgi:hypothetical protein
MEGLESGGKSKEDFWTRLAFGFKDAALEGMERRLVANTALLQLILHSITKLVQNKISTMPLLT